MSIAVPSAVRRWLVPTSAALAVIGGGVAIGLVTAAADNTLPPRSAEDLLVDMLDTRPDALQGSVTVRTELGLPPLPIPSAGSADLSSLASGTHTLNVYYSGPDHARLELLGREGRTEVVTNGTDLWVWSSAEETATHATLPADRGGLPQLFGIPIPSVAAGATPSPLPSMVAGFDPRTLVRLALGVLEPSTEITQDASASVAGRRAYEITLRPKDSGSLIDSVVLDIDATEHFPLRFAVLARDGRPAIEIAFTSVSFDRPDPSQFTFNPRPGVTVKDEPSDTADPRTPDHHPSAPDLPRFSVVGRGWTSVLVLDVPPMPEGDDVGELIGLLPRVSGDWGSGRLLSTRLFSALLTDDGRLLVGSVAPERIYQAAADPGARPGG